MKTFILALIVLSFLQSTIIPFDLVLMTLICRSYIKTDRSNLFLAFAFGLLDGHLSLSNLGLRSMVYLLVVQATESLSKSRLSINPFLIIPLSFILLSINELVIKGLIFPKVLVESLLSLPIFYLVRLWEERFIVRKDIKLKV